MDSSLQLSAPQPVDGWESGSWTSPDIIPELPASEAIASWGADTPPGCWIRVQVQGDRPDGTPTTWYDLARWSAATETGVGPRGTIPGQQDPDGRVLADTLEATDGAPFQALRLRVTLFRPAGSELPVALRMAGLVASTLPGPLPPTSTPPTTRAYELDVPALSQQIHRGEYPEFNGGGEAWCSATSTTMVLRYWGRSAAPEELVGITAPHGDADVDLTVQRVYDFSYDGAGNWPFNTAYAEERGLRGYVTRLRDLAQAETLIRAGIPLPVSVSFTRAELPEAGYSTAGHLLVIRGFTAAGDVVVNDPAAPNNADVRRIYPRGRFEHVWLAGSGGIAYIMRPPELALPESSECGSGSGADPSAEA